MREILEPSGIGSPAPEGRSEVHERAPELVKAIFQTLLGREPAFADLQHWIAFLRQCGSIDGFAAELLRSEQLLNGRAPASVPTVPPAPAANEHFENGADPRELLDPFLHAPVTVTLDTRSRVALAGSCFAQRLCARLRKEGFNFLRVEPLSGAPPVNSDEGLPIGSGDEFSARYGNVYTARQLRQLIDRAFGEFHPVEPAWKLKRDGSRWADPFRPLVDPAGFASVAELETDRSRHLAAVREMFETLDVFVFTMGLTEAWCTRADGAVFPLAPGVAAGGVDHDRHAFVNFTVAEITADLDAFTRRLRRANPNARVIFTVSPVPIAATYEDRHVLVSSTYTKSALRVAAGEVVRLHAEYTTYFPSYEMVVGPQARGVYWADDLRSVTPAGVERVMRTFLDRYAGASGGGSLEAAAEERRRQLQQPMRKPANVPCAETLVAANRG